MHFCKHCGTVMLPARKKGKIHLVCPSCGYSERKRTETRLTSKQKQEGITIVEKDIINLPKIAKICPKCGFRKAYWWSAQGGKEEISEALYYRCVKCGYVWKEE